MYVVDRIPIGIILSQIFFFLTFSLNFTDVMSHNAGLIPSHGSVDSGSVGKCLQKFSISEICKKIQN